MQIAVKQMSDNTPGLAKRYVLQEVKSSPVVSICVKVDGQCNHADKDLETVSLGHDPSLTEEAPVCNGCGSIYDKHNDEWLK